MIQWYFNEDRFSTWFRKHRNSPNIPEREFSGCLDPLSRQSICFLPAFLYLLFRTGSPGLADLVCLALSLLLTISKEDSLTGQISPEWNVGLAALGLAWQVCFFLLKGELWRAGEVFPGFLPGFLCLIVYGISGGRGIGGGDIKLLFAGGFFLGSDSMKMLFHVCLAVLLIQSFLRLQGKGGRTFALGPYLAAGIGLVMVIRTGRLC
ncbi:MAG: prepilin peptidase [Clostridiales bacterium]|nr:prepilin peptidase [Clostridiales bacterium]